jgi:dTDP-glucose 4,6-dehydratase
MELAIETMHVNTAATELLLKHATKNGSRLLFASTSEIYGDPHEHPQRESYWGNVNPIGPRSVYDEAKRFGETLLSHFHRSEGTDTVIVRIFNTYGPRQSARAVIPTLITQIAHGQRQIKLGAVSPTRDFNYVADTVSGFIAAMESDRATGEVINLGSNFEISIGDTAHAIAEAMGTSIEIITDERRIRPEKSEVERLWASNTKARELLGWQPKYGSREGFLRGLTKTIAWFREPANLSAYKADIYNL